MALARSRWCYKCKGGSWSPFGASQDATLEKTFRAIQMSAATKAAVIQQGEAAAAQTTVSTVVDVTTSDGTAYKVTFECDVRTSNVYARMKMGSESWMARQCALSRGWAGDAMERLTDAELAVQRSPSSVLVLVVHGAGDSFWRKRRGGLSESVSKMRTNATQCTATATTTSDASPVRMEFLGVEWAHSIRGGGTSRKQCFTSHLPS